MRKLMFFFTESLIGMNRSSLMIIVAKATIFISLVVFGLFLLVNFNLMRLSDYIGSTLEVRVFLKETLTKKEIQYFNSKVFSFSNIQKVEYIDKQDAWKSFKQTYPSLDLDKYVSQNPLSHSLKIYLTEQSNVDSLKRTLNNFNYFIDDVVYGGPLVDKLKNISRFILIFGWSVVSLLFFATFLIVINTIKLTIINRSEEISIMKLVGATDKFIMGPFILEGIILGGLSALAAVFVLHLSTKIIMLKLKTYLPFMFSLGSLHHLDFIYCVIVIWGIFLGVLGAFISTRSTLKNTL